jgi:alkanesulfonate monooxygenase SsuD/methylene tetrahydromethanopterin reductase-like flavin-dependent oxidoreductase (luciferase family)
VVTIQPEPMYTPPRLGVFYRPTFEPTSLPDIARAAEAAGVEELWIAEDCFLQGAFAQAGVALASTSDLCVGVGVVPAPIRSVVATALEVSTLATIYPGRVKVGVGNGVQDWMRQSGVKVASPLTLLAEYVEALRALFAGEEVTRDGRYVQLDGVRLEWAPPRPVPVLIGGNGPKTLALAPQIGDGVLLDCQHSVETVRTILSHMESEPASFERTMYLACIPGEGAPARLLDEATNWAVADPSDFGVGGTIDEIRSGIGRYMDAGVRTVILQSSGPGDDLDSVLATAARLAEPAGE